MVARQRVGLRREPRCPRRLDPPADPSLSAALRGRRLPPRVERWRARRVRRRVPDVSDDRRESEQYGESGEGTARSSCASTASDGQHQRVARRLLGRDHDHAGPTGRLHLGVEGPRHAHLLSEGTRAFAYGGQFGDEPNDGNLSPTA